ncbi:MAG: chromosome segregation protein SMC [Betaproteobacteria bacterium]|nr:chromosome segregation protein SMC [Betaproteobacteria bacterium]
MHLKHIKLAGFKSFAEPTQIPVPGKLVGVVGPNGCGKSNVIDAVRWVLGESQARHLRGETLQDVIFGGTTDRKPQGRASVELVFDNTDGRAPGQWSQYAEIAVRRVLARDGVSNYYINNVHVRRRDVQDMFMGTGLGPRAYAIIEQGMISRIIESRPEEIRVFLEEAAGISRYKERRRETELRLEDTRGHLRRTEDILGELRQQIEKLEGQAEVAGQWRGLQDELARAQNLLLFCRKRDAEVGRNRALRDIEKTQLELDAAIAGLRNVERQVEEQRTGHYAASDALNAAQGLLYQANTEVTQAENQLQALRLERHRLEEEMARLLQEIEEDQRRLESDQASLKRLQGELDRALELVQVGSARVQQEQDALPAAEALSQTRHQALDQARRNETQIQNRISTARSECTASQRLLEQLRERRERLAVEEAQWVVPDQAQLEQIARTLREREVRGAILNALREAMGVRVARCESAFVEARDQAETLRRERARIEAELKALESMQSRLGVQERVQELIRQHGLSGMPVFWQGIQVASGWERAVEAILGARLNAFRSEDYSSVMRWSPDETPAGVALFLPGATAAPARAPDLPALASRPQPLRDLVSVRTAACEAALDTWLQGVFVVENFHAALEDARHLPPGIVLVSREGHLIERHSVLFFAPQGEFHGALSRAREIEGHQQALDQRDHQSAHLDAQWRSAESALAACRAEQAATEEETRESEAARHALEVERTRLQGQLERHQQRARQVADEKIELERQQASEQDRLLNGEQQRAAAEQALRAVTAELATLDQAWREADQARDVRRSAVQSAERAFQEAGFLEKSARERMAHLEDSQRAASARLSQRLPRLQALKQELTRDQEAPLNELLQAALGRRAASEQSLSGARTALDALAATLRDLEEQRLAAQQRQDPLRIRLGELGLKEQEARLNLERANESLQTNKANEAELAEMLEKGIRTTTLQADIAGLSERIEALGAVNLVALAELETARQRKAWLDAQVADLVAAVETLESAMRKIDRETREQLKETFERVNASFSVLFPTLFGGGHARIELTGEEILDAGVLIIGQPPGKKTTSIQLLSGGEKALTALALVFSLFQLNPAPFCLLDEVDAPLDDANTERFVQLVQKMSEQTQFLFITHNKIAMEMAHQLVGITMAESGVSRMVAVDIEEAIRLTETVPA